MTDKWNGQGLPPVGEVCEFLGLDNSWYECIYHGRTVAARPIIEIPNSVLSVRAAREDTKFRPLKSEAERKRDEAVEKMMDYVPNGLMAHYTEPYSNKQREHLVIELLNSLHIAGYRKVNELTDEQITQIVNKCNGLKYGVSIAVATVIAEIMGEES